MPSLKIGKKTWYSFGRRFFYRLGWSDRSSLAGVNGDGAVVPGQILVGDTLHLGCGNCLDFRPGVVYLSPVPVTIIADELEQDRKIRGEAAIFAGSEIVFHLLQLFRWDEVLVELFDVFINSLLDLLG